MKQISWPSYYQNVPMFLVLIDSILSRPENQISIERNSVEKPSVTNNAHFRPSVAYSISAIILKKEWLSACLAFPATSSIKTLILLGVPMLLGVSERALTSFEQRVFGNPTVSNREQRGQVSYFANQLTARVRPYPFTRQPTQLTCP
jgi:hypothetical protein